MVPVRRRLLGALGDLLGAERETHRNTHAEQCVHPSPPLPSLVAAVPVLTALYILPIASFFWFIIFFLLRSTLFFPLSSSCCVSASLAFSPCAHSRVHFAYFHPGAGSLLWTRLAQWRPAQTCREHREQPAGSVLARLGVAKMSRETRSKKKIKELPSEHF